jgi:hypothetical protein
VKLSMSDSFGEYQASSMVLAVSFQGYQFLVTDLRKVAFEN